MKITESITQSYNIEFRGKIVDISPCAYAWSALGERYFCLNVGMIIGICFQYGKMPFICSDIPMSG